MSDQLVERLISGAIAGIVGTLTIYPIDSVKTRLQSGLYPSCSAIGCARLVLKTEGLHGFYRGLSANLIGVTPEKAIKLAVNDWMRVKFSRRLGLEGDAQLPPLYGMLAGAIAGFCQVIATNPMEITKIHMQLASSSSDIPKSSLVQTVRGLGLKGLYRGTVSTWARDVPFSIIFFQSFASLKTLFCRMQGDGLMPVLEAGLLSGALAAIAMTPMDVVKTRLQMSPFAPKSRMIDIYQEVWRELGLRGFFRGAIQRAITSAPLFGISLLAYEVQKKYFISSKK